MHDRFTASATGRPTTGEKRVLIVEDEPIIAFSLEDVLTELGYTVVAVAGDVASSIRLVPEVRPDVAILDVNLHGVKSYPVADLLEERGVKYLFATGYGDEEHPERHREAVTITKPYNVDQLKTALAKIEA